MIIEIGHDRASSSATLSHHLLDRLRRERLAAGWAEWRPSAAPPPLRDIPLAPPADRQQTLVSVADQAFHRTTDVVFRDFVRGPVLRAVQERAAPGGSPVRSPRATIISAWSGNGRRIVKAASPSAVGSASSPLRFAGEIPRFAGGKPRWPSVRVSANRRGFPDDKNPRNSRRLARRFPVCERIPTVLLRPAPNVGRQSLPANSVSQTERWRGRPRALSD